MPMLDPSRVVVPVTRGKGDLAMFCHSLKESQQTAPEAPKTYAKAICEDAPRERRDVSHMLQVQARARQQRGCIHSPVNIPSLSNPNRAKTSARPRAAPPEVIPCSGPTDLRHAR